MRFNQNYDLLASHRSVETPAICNRTFDKILETLLLLCENTVLQTKLVAPPDYWTTTSTRKSCRIFSLTLQVGMIDVLFVCLFVTQWDLQQGQPRPHCPLQGTQKTGTKEIVCVWWTCFKGKTLRPSFFSRGCETEEPAAPPTLCTTPPPSCCDTIGRRRLKEPLRCEDLQPGHIGAPETQIGALNHVTSCWAFHVFVGQRKPLMKGTSVKGRLMRLAALLARGNVRRRQGRRSFHHHHFYHHQLENVENLFIF